MTLYVIFIFWLSSAPRRAPTFLRWRGADKLFHLAEYAPLGSLLLRAFGRSCPPSCRRALGLFTMLAGLMVGSADEFYQSFIPTRTSSLWDLMADGMGVLAGKFLYGLKVAKTP